jgi:hypothetical protein
MKGEQQTEGSCSARLEEKNMSMFGGVESNLIEIGEKTRRPMLEMRRSVNSRAKQHLYDALTSWEVRDTIKCSIVAEAAKGVSQDHHGFMVGNAGSEALNPNGALRSTCSGRCLTGSADDDHQHRSALPTGTEARAPQKANQLDEDTLPLMLYLTEWKRTQDACCPFTKCVLAIGSIFSQGDMGRRALFRIKYEAANGIHPCLLSPNHTRDGSR